MPEPTPDPVTPVPGVVVEEPVVKKGTVKFMSAAGFKNPAPQILKKVLAAVKYFCAGLVTTVGATDLFSGLQSKVIMFCLGIVILLCGAIEYATGVQSVSDAKKDLEKLDE